MANNIANYVSIIANEETITRIDNMFENAGGYAETLKFSETFYGDLVEDSNEWYLDNLGAKWVYVENNIDFGKWNIQSASYTPKEFFIQLYKLITETDPEGYVEVKFEDEGCSPIGALVVKKSKSGHSCISIEEDYDVVDPTEDMDWDDEEYENTRMEFTDTKFDLMDSLLKVCHDTIDENNGEIVLHIE
jgi:hypothetical protein